MISLIDTNILIYRFDSRFPAKQAKAVEILRNGLDSESVVLCHQSLVEFVSVATRPMRDGTTLLSPAELQTETEQIIEDFTILYPTSDLFRIAVAGFAAYQLSWYDAHLWAYAEFYGIPELLSEDFQDGRRYGNVTVRNPLPS